MKKVLYILTLAVLCLASCKKDATESGTFLYLGKGIEDDKFEMDWQGTVYNGTTLVKFKEAYATNGLCPRVELFSDLNSWKIAPEKEEDSEWLFFWPSEGARCGLFFVTVDRNLRAESRTAVIDIKDGTGKVWKTFTISQTGSEPYLELDMGGINSFNVAAEQGSLEIKLKTNTLWKVEPSGEGADWVSIKDISESSLTMAYSQNTQDDGRSATYVISRQNESQQPMSISFSINQIGGKNAFSKAQKISIAQLKSDFLEEMDITDNVYIEGTVTSNYSKLNIDENFFSYTKDGNKHIANISNVPMWIQDDAGDAISVEFISANENQYAPGTRMKLHIVGQTFGRNQAGVLRLAGLTAAYVHDAAQGSEPAPIEVSDLSTLYKYEDKLVTLKDVQFAIPFGTYYNADTNNLTYVETSYPDMVDATPRQYPCLLFDKFGNTARMLTASTFIDRFSRMIPEGVGDITGIVSRRFRLGGETEFYIRMRSAQDDKVKEDRDGNCAKILLRFGPYTEASNMESVLSNEGVGSLRTSVFKKLKASSSSTDMYFVYSGLFKNTNDNLTKDSTPIPHSASTVYHAINSQQWYNATGTTLTDAPGEAWIITTNTTAAGTGKLFVAFANASYSSGPKDFCLEWSTNENAPVSEWNTVVNYQTTSWSANWQIGQFMFPLPEEAKGLETLVIRHRVTSNLAVNKQGGTVSATGTNRMGYWALIELQ